MIEFKCIKCGCNEFKVSELGMHIQCVFCKEKYEHTSEGWIHLIKPTLLQKIMNTIKQVNPFELKQETKKELFERLGIEKEKKTICENKIKQIQLHRIKECRERIRLNWDNEIFYLNSKQIVWFNKADHKGKLRGKAIARAFSKRLKELGVEHEVRFGDSESFVRLKVVK